MGKEKTGQVKQIQGMFVKAGEVQESLFMILDSIDAFIYVADMETYEILFVNKHIRDFWGDVLGKKCWQEIQAEQSGPCKFCNNYMLTGEDGKPAGVQRRVFQNTRNGRWYDCRDCAIYWEDGRLVRLEIALDITEWKITEEELARLRVLHALEEERMRLARDLHDELGMTLTTVKLDLQVLKKSLPQNESALHNRLLSSINLVDSSLDRVREKSVSLRPPALDDLGLVPAVNNLVEAIRQCSSVKICFTAPGEKARFGADLEITLYRCIQEALSNVVRHSFATEVYVELGWSRSEIRLQVQDNGIGFKIDNTGKFCKTLGLQGIKERVSLLGGTFAVNSSPGNGTIICIEIPLKAG